MESGETFLCLTETGWVAVGSIVSACSIIVLSILNWLSLRAAQESAGAATEQADAAKASLDELRAQFQQQGIAQKENAIAVLEEVSRSALNWKNKLAVDYQGEVKLFPRDWVTVMIFTSLQVAEIKSSMHDLEQEIAQTEGMLIEYMHRDPIGRKVITQSTKMLDEALDRTANDTRVIADQLRGWNRSVRGTG
jgi:hypothetical protein